VLADQDHPGPQGRAEKAARQVFDRSPGPHGD